MLDGIAGGEIFCVVIDQPRGIDAIFHFCGSDIAAFHQIKADRFAQDQRVAMTKDIVRQLVKLLILEGTNTVTNHKQRLFRHESAKCMFKLRHAIEIDKKRSADLNNGVVT